MESTTTTSTYVPPSQHLPAQTQMISEAALNDAYGAPVEKSVCLGASAILLRVFCLLGCLAVLISASLAVSAINDVEGAYDYEHADDYRIAAVFLVSLAVLAIIYHSVAIVVRIIYFKSNMGKHFGAYSFANALLSLLFGPGLLSGAIVNLVYAHDNRDLYNDLECETYRYISTQYEFCGDLETVYASEIAAATFALFSLVMFISLFVISLISGVRKMQETSNMRSVPTSYSYSPLQ